MASSLSSIIARARVIATGMGTDPNSSPLVDSRPALRALANHAIRHVYKERAKSKNFVRDINVRHIIAVADGVGALPEPVLREFIKQAEFTDEESANISYCEYGTDYRANRYNQIGYVTVQGNDLLYTKPFDADDVLYTGNLFMTAPSVPVIPEDAAEEILMTTDVTEAVIMTLALALRGEIQLEAN